MDGYFRNARVSAGQSVLIRDVQDGASSFIKFRQQVAEKAIIGSRIISKRASEAAPTVTTSKKEMVAQSFRHPRH